MALGTITKPSPSQDFTAGNRRFRTRDVVLGTGANYPTGGETITPAAVGLGRRIEQVWTTSIARATAGGATGRTVSVDYTAIAGSPGAVKIQIYTTGSAEVANNSDQSAFSVRLTFIGQ